MQTEKVVTHIENWLKDYSSKSGMKGFVVGISGGIDSAVTSTLCARTGLPTLCVEMPIHQDKKQLSRAQEHIQQLSKGFANVSHVQVDLTQTFEVLKSSFPSVTPSDKHVLSLANTRARLRMTSLYYFAGMHQYLVAGTGNKVEDFGVGFFTKYGDGGVDLSPIADLLKSEVYTLGKFFGVAETIQNAPPTDGLFGDNRSDEDQIGATYNELEWAMKMDDNNKTPEDFTGREAEVFAIYKKLHVANQHKMKPIPVCEIPLALK